MTFEEKRIKAFEKSIYSMTPDKNTYEALQGSFDLAWKLARQETLREVIPVLEKAVQHWGDYAPQRTNARQTLDEAKDLLKKLEAEREG